MLAGKAFLLIKIKAVDLGDPVAFPALIGGQDITNGQGIQIIVFGGAELYLARKIGCDGIDQGDRETGI